MTCKGPPGSEDFVNRQPIQVRLEEYVTFTPWQPLPIETHDGFNGYIVRKLSATEEESTVGIPFSSPTLTIVIFSAFWKRIQFSDGNTEKNFHYEPFRLSGAIQSGRDPRHALDVVIAGEVCPFCLDEAHLILTDVDTPPI